METRYKVCKDCGSRKRLHLFPATVKTYVRKNGETISYNYHKKYCKSCASDRTKQRKIQRELMKGTGSNSGVVVSLRTILHGIKRTMNQEQDIYLRYAWAKVGLELNNLLLKL